MKKTAPAAVLTGSLILIGMLGLQRSSSDPTAHPPANTPVVFFSEGSSDDINDLSGFMNNL